MITRLTRLTSILLQLQSKRVVRSQELADKFNISQRTVYRDIKALEEAGVPVIGEAGLGYSLMDDYQLPPVMFTEQEINALLTAQQYFKTNSDLSTSVHIDTLVAKVKVVLKHVSKNKTEKLGERLKIYTTSDIKDKSDFLSKIQLAITNSTVLKITYHGIYNNAVSTRDIEPLAVYFTKNNWILIANCRLRNDLREFRLDKIIHLTELQFHFEETNFTFEKYIYQQSEKSRTLLT